MWLNEYTYKKPTGNGSSRMSLFFFFFFLLPPSLDSLQISTSIFHLSVDRMQLSAAPVIYHTTSGSSDPDGHVFYVKRSCLLGTLPRPSHTLSSEACPVSIGQLLWGNGFASRESGISGVSVASCVFGPFSVTGTLAKLNPLCGMDWLSLAPCYTDTGQTESSL